MSEYEINNPSSRNFFLALELPHHTPVTGSEGQKRIEELQKKWNQLKNKGKKTEADKILLWLETIRKRPANATLSDTLKRRVNLLKEEIVGAYGTGTEREFLPKMAKEAEKTREEKLIAAVKEYENDGILEASEFQELLRRFTKSPYAFDEELIKRRLSLPIAEPMKEPTPPESLANVKTLDKSRMDHLDQLIAVYNNEIGVRKSANRIVTVYDLLYDLLARPRKDADVPDALQNKSASEIHRTTVSLYNKNQERHDRSIRMEKITEILGIAAEECFASSEAKTGYDLALERRPIDRLYEKFALRIKAASISPEDYLDSLTEAREAVKGGDAAQRERADWYVYEFYCRQKKCPFPPRMFDPEKRARRCWCCHAALSTGTKVCPGCQTLQTPEECPNCHRAIEGKERLCPVCGFAIGEMPNAKRLMERAKRKIDEGRFFEAEESIQQAKRWWPGNPGIDELARTLERSKRETEERKKRVAVLEDQIRHSIRLRRLFQANKELAALRALAPESPILSEEGISVTESLDRIAAMTVCLAETGQIETKRKLCGAILQIAADAENALAVLDALPPEPPSDLRVQATRTGIELRWRPSPSAQKIGYLVVRKIGAAPSSPNDGQTLLESTPSDFYIDAEARPGLIYGYAVFSRRGASVDPVGARSLPVQIIRDAEHLRIFPGDQTLSLEWKSPPGVFAAVISRWKGRVDVGEKTEFRLVGRNDFVDTRLTNGALYAYRVQLIYKAPDGSERFSDGVTLTGSPCETPKPVTDLSARRSGCRTAFTWTPPKSGTLFLFAPKEDTTPLYGKVESIPLSELEARFGPPIPILKPASGTTERDDAAFGIRYYLPVTMAGGVAVYGRTEPNARIRPPENPRVQYADEKFYLSWDWPKEIDRVRIVRRRDRTPEGPQDPRGRIGEITRDEYDAEKARVCPNEERDDYFALYSVFQNGKIYSDGVPFFAGKIQIHYALQIPRTFSGSAEATLEIRRETGDGPLPELLVRKKFGEPPLSRDDGEPILTLPATGENRLRVNIPIVPGERHAFIRLFVGKSEEEAIYDFNRHPPEELQLHRAKKGLLSFLWR